MNTMELVKMILEDDREREKMTLQKATIEHLEKLEFEERPSNAYYVLELSLGSVRDSEKVFDGEGLGVEGRNITIPPQAIDYWVEWRKGRRVKVNAGDKFVLSDFAYRNVWITNFDTHESVMQVYVSGKKRFQV